LRDEFSSELGFVLPRVRIRDTTHLENTEYAFFVNGLCVAKGNVCPDRHLAIGAMMIGVGVFIPGLKYPRMGEWIDKEDTSFWESNGYIIVDASTVIMNHFRKTIIKYVDDFNHQPTKKPATQKSKK
jgi:flagellar biosynthesis protein FlhA